MGGGCGGMEEGRSFFLGLRRSGGLKDWVRGLVGFASRWVRRNLTMQSKGWESVASTAF